MHNNNNNKKETISLFHFSDSESSWENFKHFYARLKTEQKKLDRPFLTIFAGDIYLYNKDWCFNSSSYDPSILINALNIDISCLGNHEFDLRHEVMASFFKKTSFQSLGTNLKFKVQSPLYPLTQGSDPKIIKSKVLSCGPYKIGFVGLVPCFLEQLAPISADEIEVLQNRAAIINNSVKELTENNELDYVIALSHSQSLEIDKKIIPELKGVDLVISGGGNERLLSLETKPDTFPFDDIYDTYPLNIKDSEGKETILVCSDGSFKYFNRIDLAIGNQQRLSLSSFEHFCSYQELSFDERAVLSASDKKLLKEISNVENDIGSRHSDVIKDNCTLFPYNRTLMRSTENSLANYITDSFYSHALDHLSDSSKYLISFKNGGGIRDTLTVKNGEGGFCISKFQIDRCLQFNDEIVLARISLETLLSILKHSYRYYGVRPHAALLHLSGAKVELCANQNEAHIHKLEIYNLTSHQYDLINLNDPSIEVDITLPLCLFQGVDGFSIQNQNLSSNILPLNERNALLQFIAKAGDSTIKRPLNRIKINSN